MAKFLIEVPHEAETLACARVVKVFLESGSHFLTHAEWGCMDGVHSAWILVEVNNKAEALAIVPAPMRPQTRIVRVHQFKLDDIERTLRQHQPSREPGDATRG